MSKTAHTPRKPCALRLKRKALAHFKTRGRSSLPWRKLQSPYAVVVSEYMLQQTQVERVAPKFEAFLKALPDWQSLARANVRSVYELWRGLGYNRRAKYLRDAAKRVASLGELPDDDAFICSLPGVGPYTAGAIRAFAFGNAEPFVETNIRTAVIHHCFPGTGVVRDEEIVKVLKSLRPRRGREARNWYAALMDYGGYLKRSGLKLNHRAHGYTKQSKFEGSLRQLRGELLRALAEQSATGSVLVRRTKRKTADVQKALVGLLRDGLIEKSGTRYMLSD